MPERPRIEVSVVPLAGAGDTPLSEDEQKRAEAISDRSRRERYRAAHRILRLTLASASGREPAELRFVSSANGKPELAGGRPHFSLAYTDTWCAVAVSTDCWVGVDIEEIGQRADLQTVVSELVPQARAELAVARAEELPQEALHWWARAEAAVKACGATLDDAAESIARVRCEVASPLPTVVVAIAALAAGAPRISWSLPSAGASAAPPGRADPAP